MRPIPLALLAAACAGSTATAPAPKSAAQADKKGELKPWADALKDTHAERGFIVVHMRRDHALLAELPVDRLDRDFGLAVQVARGLGDLGVIGGSVLDQTALVRLRRVGDTVYVVRANTAFTADAGSPMRRSLEANSGDSVIAALKVESERPDKKAILVDLTPLLVSDYPDLGSHLKGHYGDGPKPGPAPTLERERSFVATVQAFPKNVEVDVELSYKATEPPRDGVVGASDYRALPISVRYSLFALPDTPMAPRDDDDRVGYFAETVFDFSRDRNADGHVGRIHRWRLEKADPAAAVSAPKQPIVFYIDRSVPTAYRPVVKEAILAWNVAFAQAGWKDAIVVRDAPDDPAWSPDDIRNSTVRWAAAYHAPYSAVGQSEVDPRTGEILRAEILVSAAAVRTWAREYQEAYGREPTGACAVEAETADQLALADALLQTPGGLPVPDEVIGAGLRWMLMHEVGHTLGLRHNFRASSAVANDRLRDPAWVKEHGTAVSVMDYLPMNVGAERKPEGLWGGAVGPYDVWAIRYGYSAVDAAGLTAILAEAGDPTHTFGTDEDAAGDMAADPLTHRYDLGADALAWAAERVAIVDGALPGLEGKLLAPGESLARLRAAVGLLVREHFRAIGAAVGDVGGITFERQHAGGRPPLQVVPAARQRAALKLIVDKAFAPGALALPPDLIAHLAPNRAGNFDETRHDRAQVDFPLHQLVLGAQEQLLDALLSPPRLTRLVDAAAWAPPGQAFTLADLFDGLVQGVFGELAARRPIDSFRRNLQRATLERLIALLVHGPKPAPAAGRPGHPEPQVPEDARSLARYHLVRLSAQMRTALASAQDTVTRAHLEESRARIERALGASLTLTP
jgi:hypothetical protein